MNETMRNAVMVLLAALAVVACAAEPQAPPSQGGSLPPSFWSELPGRSLARRQGPVVRHVIDGKIYYFARSPCCDIPHGLYDERGDFVCMPSGGFAGGGDGKCPALREALARSAGEQIPNPFHVP